MLIMKSGYAPLHAQNLKLNESSIGKRHEFIDILCGNIIYSSKLHCK